MRVRPAPSEPNATAGPGDLASSAVDLQHLSRYTLGDPRLDKEILHLFLAQLPETIAALDTAKSERDWKIAAHTLKGSSRAVGAWRIARLAEDAEGLPFDISREARGETISGLEEAVTDARAYIIAVYGPV
jgi:HPt (histidine-containing phosphotransfer) domain-containing protein